MFMPVGGSELVVILFIVVANLLLVVYPAVSICRRLGFSAGLGVLAIVPIANFVLLWFVAMAAWPIERAVAERDGLAEA